MDEETTLLQEAEFLRIRMIGLASERGSLTDDDVLAASQDLDKIMVKLQKLKLHNQHIFLSSDSCKHTDPVD